MLRASRKYEELEKRLAQSPVITVPTITMEGDANGAPHPKPAAYAQKFSRPYEHRNITEAWGTTCRRKRRRRLPGCRGRRELIGARGGSVRKRSDLPQPVRNGGKGILERIMRRIAKVLHTAEIHTSGGRENGASRGSDGRPDIRIAKFAAAWSACLESAIAQAAQAAQAKNRLAGRRGHRRGSAPQGRGRRLAPFKPNRLAKPIRKLADDFDLPATSTLNACRHGGMAELEEAELTTGQDRALSGHRTDRACSGHAKFTQDQAMAATRKRHAHLLPNEAGTNRMRRGTRFRMTG